MSIKDIIQEIKLSARQNKEFVNVEHWDIDIPHIDGRLVIEFDQDSEIYSIYLWSGLGEADSYGACIDNLDLEKLKKALLILSSISDIYDS